MRELVDVVMICLFYGTIFTFFLWCLCLAMGRTLTKLHAWQTMCNVGSVLLLTTVVLKWLGL